MLTVCVSETSSAKTDNFAVATKFYRIRCYIYLRRKWFTQAEIKWRYSWKESYFAENRIPM